MENFIEDAEEGDSLVIQFSCHGTQISTTDTNEVDGFSEALCLYDKYLIDQEIEAILSKLKPNIKLTIISDSCYSGNLTRDIKSDYIKPRCAQPHKLPVIHTIKKRRRLFRLVDDQEQMNHILISGCDEGETSADGCFNGIYEGAMSHYGIKTIRENKDLTYQTFYDILKGYIPNDLYLQHPQLECSSLSKNLPLFV